ncbi:HD domain-containing phosphohydrolase [Gracilibacillus sp. YIM 98692]|uniref:HD-GYP domain-containing protein n=1 Tax=Gracilibacillus sp. YIM 98692 TaxID=2663532 RepID=UPI001F088C81|nr:HD domain-containing phosphohydrolase [Gracilibacillus sp. YIM 98692]
MHPSQLIPGCLIVDAVKDNSNHPIIPSNTAINPKHIQILLQLGIEQVEVSEKLSNGGIFHPKRDSHDDRQLFYNMYIQTVRQYKKLFHQWKTTHKVIAAEVIDLMNPILDLLDEVKMDIFALSEWSTKQDYFYHHAVSLSLLSGYLAKMLGLKKEWKQVAFAGALADCGKALIHTNCYLKDKRLTLSDYKQLQKHPLYSYRLIKYHDAFPNPVIKAVLQHHERSDGSGYPFGIKGDNIHLFAKILALCDMYHAMTSERIYSKKQTPFKVAEYLIRSEQGKLDKRVLKCFIQSFFLLPKGTRVLLSNQKEAYIQHTPIEYPVRPTVVLKENGKVLDLKKKPAWYIEKWIQE